MRLLSIDDSILNWIIDFLLRRKQRVKLGLVLSDWKLVNGGVRKWCIENDMAFNHSKCKELIISFAKDIPDLRLLLVGAHQHISGSID